MTDCIIVNTYSKGETVCKVYNDFVTEKNLVKAVLGKALKPDSINGDRWFCFYRVNPSLVFYEDVPDSINGDRWFCFNKVNASLAFYEGDKVRIFMKSGSENNQDRWREFISERDADQTWEAIMNNKVHEVTVLNDVYRELKDKITNDKPDAIWFLNSSKYNGNTTEMWSRVCGKNLEGKVLRGGKIS